MPLISLTDCMQKFNYECCNWYVTDVSSPLFHRLHFRPKTPPPSPPSPSPPPDDNIPIELDTPLCVELRSPSQGLCPFTTCAFTLGSLYDAALEERGDSLALGLDHSGEDLLADNFTGLTEAQVESILSGTSRFVRLTRCRSVLELLRIECKELSSFDEA